MNHEEGQQLTLTALLSHHQREAEAAMMEMGNDGRGQGPDQGEGAGFLGPIRRYLAACPEEGEEGGSMLSLLNLHGLQHKPFPYVVTQNVHWGRL